MRSTPSAATKYSWGLRVGCWLAATILLTYVSWHFVVGPLKGHTRYYLLFFFGVPMILNAASAALFGFFGKGTVCSIAVIFTCLALPIVDLLLILTVGCVAHVAFGIFGPCL
jgi:hypothetical protein